MHDIVSRLEQWHSVGMPYALATVVSVSGSAPRLPGAAMAVSADGEAVGSVSGGCVESAVYELCRDVLADGECVRASFGYSDDDAFAVGLTCGGVIEVFVSIAPPHSVVQAVAAGEPVVTAQILDGSGAMLVLGSHGISGTTGCADVDAVLAHEASAMADSGSTGLRSVRCRPHLDVFVASYAPKPRLLIFGAIDYAGALARLGKFLGYVVTVCDARPVFATTARFPDADEVIAEWPHRYLARTQTDSHTVVCVLTHDARFDISLLEVALRLPVAFVGAMGSRRTHLERMRRLRETGLTEEELARLRSPIGLDLGARTPEETAVSIAAEFVAVGRGGSALPLVESSGAIHHEVVPAYMS
ncbi:MAG: XdhC family protein [Rhodococcus sp. (in: high G+C Gram-positive bacteria)]